MADRVTLLKRAVVPWNACLLAGILSLLIGTALAGLLTGKRPAAFVGGPSAHLSHDGLSRLPATARGPVSGALGAADGAYEVRGAGHALHAVNPAQHLRIGFESAGVLLRSGASQLRLRLDSFGYGDTLSAVGAVAPHARANRVLYEHAGVSESYANGPLGLEQGFTVSRAPAGNRAEPLTLSMAVSGGHVALAKGGRSVLLGGNGRTSLRYGELRASDARGRTLRSWLAVRDGRVLLQVDARTARYPLRIDPLVQEGDKLTGEGEEGAGMFGYSVALSADGRSALIGAPADAGRKGAAWYFRGTGTGWSIEGPKLRATEARGNPAFGWSGALSADGGSALVGGPSQTEPCPTASEPARECHGAGAVWPFVQGSEGEVNEENTNALGPRVNGVTPNTGPVSGETVVTISGSGLSGATGVAFGSTSATFTVNSNNAITAISPPHQAGTVDVTVITGSATSPTSLHDRFTYPAGALATGDASAAASATAAASTTGGGSASGHGEVLALGPTGNCVLKLTSRKIAVRRGARAALKLLARGSGFCRGAVRLSARSSDARGRLRTRTIASRTFELPTGRTVQVVLTLNSPGRKLLRSGHGQLAATVALASVVSGRTARASLAGVRLTLAQPQRRRR